MPALNENAFEAAVIAFKKVPSEEGELCLRAAITAYTDALQATKPDAVAVAVKAERKACAKIAKERHKHWRLPHPDDARKGEVCDDISACADIAAAILARSQP